MFPCLDMKFGQHYRLFERPDFLRGVFIGPGTIRDKTLFQSNRELYTWFGNSTSGNHLRPSATVFNNKASLFNMILLGEFAKMAAISRAVSKRFNSK